jgi:hypothetical protein
MGGDAVKLILSSLLNLETLDASFLDGVSDDHLAFPNGCRLKSLSILRSNITIVGARKIGDHCKRLNVLKLGWSLDVCNEGIEHIAKSCPDLREVNINNCGRVTSRGVAMLASYCPKITTLDISWCQGIEDAVLAGAVSHWLSLETICVVWCPLIGQQTFAALEGSCGALMEVKVGGGALSSSLDSKTIKRLIARGVTVS